MFAWLLHEAYNFPAANETEVEETKNNGKEIESKSQTMLFVNAPVKLMIEKYKILFPKSIRILGSGKRIGKICYSNTNRSK